MIDRQVFGQNNGVCCQAKEFGSYFKNTYGRENRLTQVVIQPPLSAVGLMWLPLSCLLFITKIFKLNKSH